MKIFISHATDDQNIATPLVRLLTDGVGFRPGDVFYSGMKGSIKNGDFFVETILSGLVGAELTVSLLSPNYFGSQFCVTELGYAFTRNFKKQAKFRSYTIPPLRFQDFKGVLTGVQSEHITDTAALSALRRELTNAPPTPKWKPALDAFLKEVGTIVERRKARDSLSRLKIIDVYRDSNQKYLYKSKLRVLLQNNTRTKITVKNAEWAHGDDGVAMQHPRHGPKILQLEGPDGWAANKWLDEQSEITVVNGAVFQLWIGLNQSYDAVDIRRRQITQRLGTLKLTVVIKGFELPWQRQL